MVKTKQTEEVGPVGEVGSYGPNDTGYMVASVRRAAEFLVGATDIYSEGHYAHSNARKMEPEHPIAMALKYLALFDAEKCHKANETHDPKLFAPHEPTEEAMHRWDYPRTSNVGYAHKFSEEEIAVAKEAIAMSENNYATKEMVRKQRNDVEVKSEMHVVKSEMCVSVDELTNACAELEDIVRILFVRMEPVLRPERPECEKNVNDPKECQIPSPLVSDVRAAYKRVAIVVVQLSLLMQRLEI